MDCIEFANKHLGVYEVNEKDEIIAEMCPYCNGNGKDRKTFALNIEKGTYNCLRGSCGEKGTFYKLLKDFGEIHTADKRYIFPAQPKKQVMSQEIIDYLKLRGFSQKTWEKRGLIEKDGAIVFPYYDENSNLVMLKYRMPGKKGKQWREKGGKPIFWGMDKCDYNKPLLIVEGEMDALALDECGCNNVVSVPSGSSDLTCVELCWNWLEKFKQITIWGDNDEPGRKMVEKLILRIGECRCSTVESPHKDANEHLFKDGKGNTLKAVLSAREVPLAGLLRLSEVEVFDINKAEKVLSGIYGIDNQIGGYMMGEVSLWTGDDASGKSTFLGQQLIEAIEQGVKVCAYSGELSAPLIRYWIELQMAGRDHIISTESRPPKRYVSKETREKLKWWYKDMFFLYDSLRENTTTDILKIFEFSVKKHNVKVLLIDNIMTTIFDSSEKNYYHRQSEFIKRMKEFAKKYLVHIHIVAHPKKTKGSIEKDDISGSRQMSQLSDNVFCIERITEDEGGGATLRILKNRFLGRQDIHVPLLFDDVCRRFYVEGEEFKKYSWEAAEKSYFC